MHRRAFFGRLLGATGAAALVAGCDGDRPDTLLVEAITPQCARCGWQLARPDNFQRLPLRQRLGPVLSPWPCGCGEQWYATFQRPLK